MALAHLHIIAGPPGSGKAAQAQALCNEHYATPSQVLDAASLAQNPTDDPWCVSESTGSLVRKGLSHNDDTYCLLDPWRARTTTTAPGGGDEGEQKLEEPPMWLQQLLATVRHDCSTPKHKAYGCILLCLTVDTDAMPRSVFQHLHDAAAAPWLRCHAMILRRGAQPPSKQAQGTRPAARASPSNK